MARYPLALWRPIPENATQPRIQPTQHIRHTAVDHPGPTDLGKWFGRPEVRVESHFWSPTAGQLEQFMDTEIRADANRRANVRAVSTEFEDDGDPEGNPLTDKQLQDDYELTRWLQKTHGIPLRLCTTEDAPGQGWHSMWGFRDPIAQIGPVQDNPWSTVPGKTCPGKTRIHQFLTITLPRLTGEESTMEMSTREATSLVLHAYRVTLGTEPDPSHWVKRIQANNWTSGQFMAQFFSEVLPKLPDNAFGLGGSVTVDDVVSAIALRLGATE